MASGKSTAAARARRPARRWRAEDVDDLIEAARAPVDRGDLFTQHGEPTFPGRRTRRCLALLQPLRRIVVATGGGTFCDAENRALINRDGVSIWLDVPLVELIPRIPLDGRRPLAADRAQLDRLYASRIGRTPAPAHLRIDAAPGVGGRRWWTRVLDALRQPPFLNPSGLDRRQ